MDLKEAVTRSVCERHANHPDIIDSDYGLGEFPEIGVTGVPSWGSEKPHPKRSIVLEITTLRAITAKAIHFYGTLVVDGVSVETTGILDKPKHLSSDEQKKYPMLRSGYEFEINRLLTQKEIDGSAGTGRWDWFEAGDLTRRYVSLDQLIADAREIIKLRFRGNWDIYIKYPKGKIEPMNLHPI